MQPDNRLTRQELRIAELVAEGSSNREVGEHLFLSPRTVGAHLEHVYRKLGVSSRTAMARVLRERFQANQLVDGTPRIDSVRVTFELVAGGAVVVGPITEEFVAGPIARGYFRRAG